MPIDGGNLILTEDEKNNIITDHPSAKKAIRKYIGASEFMKNTWRYCLWFDGKGQSILDLEPIIKRLNLVKIFRAESSNKSTQLLVLHHRCIDG